MKHSWPSIGGANWFICFVSLLVVGCVTTASALKGRFARERGCPASQVEVEAAGGTHYRVSGCGETTVYACGSVTRAEDSARDCAEQGARPPPGSYESERDRRVRPPPDPRIPGG
jgi:hypothetical protein